MAISPSFTYARAFNGPSRLWSIYTGQGGPGSTLVMSGSNTSSTNTTWASWYPGLGNFCIEAWVNMTAAAGSGIGTIWTLGGLGQAVNADLGLSLFSSSGGYTLSGSLMGTTDPNWGTIINAGVTPLSSAYVQLNTWTHVAMTRSSGTVNLWVGGVLSYTQSYSTNMTNPSATGARIGMFGTNANNRYNVDATGYNFAGYVRNVRYVTGNAVYTAPFTPPPVTAFLPPITGTYYKMEPVSNAGDFSVDPNNTAYNYGFMNEINAPSANYSIYANGWSDQGDFSTYTPGFSLYQ